MTTKKELSEQAKVLKAPACLECPQRKGDLDIEFSNSVPESSLRVDNAKVRVCCKAVGTQMVKPKIVSKYDICDRYIRKIKKRRSRW